MRKAADECHAAGDRRAHAHRCEKVRTESGAGCWGRVARKRRLGLPDCNPAFSAKFRLRFLESNQSFGRLNEKVDIPRKSNGIQPRTKYQLRENIRARQTIHFLLTIFSWTDHAESQKETTLDSTRRVVLASPLPRSS